MKLYIFGAGASLGSQNNEYSLASSSRAPLINELFDGRYIDHSSYMLTSNELDTFRQQINARGDRSVEEWLGDRWKKINEIKSSTHKNSQIRLFGRIVMYVWNTLRVVSNTYDSTNTYRSFLSNLDQRDEPFGIINFNYDTLLDRAYEEVFHKSFLRIDDYLAENLVKPHGSINWVIDKRKTDPIVPSNSDIKTRIDLAMDNFFMNGAIPITELRVLRPSLEQIRHSDIAVVWRDLGMDYFYPLIFLPIAEKKLDHFIDFYDQVMEKGKELAQQADEVYVIGYRAKDSIIKELIPNVPDGSLLHVISNGSADDISKEILSWASNLRQGSILDFGFTEFNSRHFLNPEITK